MKSNLTITTLKAVLALSMVTSFVACTSNAQSRKPAALGTQDTGGGNGLADGKIYEAYIIDVKELPAYQKYVKPILQKLDDEKDKKEGKEGFEALLRMKSWYLAPMSLKPLSKDAIGFSVSDVENVQYAVQTKHKIVIDKNLFDKMSLEEQGRLIWHEIVMNLYLVKYMSFAEISEAICRGGGECQNAQDLEAVTAYVEVKYKAQKYRPLSKSDYEHIRAATAWLFKYGNSTEVTRSKIFRILLSHNFDGRIFNPQNDSEKRKEIKIENSPAVLLKAYQKGLVLGSLPTKCYGLVTGIEFDCKITFEKQAPRKVPYGKYMVDETPFVIKIESDKVTRVLTTQMNSSTSGEISSNGFYNFMMFENGNFNSCSLGGKREISFTMLSTQDDYMSDTFDVNKAVFDIEAVTFETAVIFEVGEEKEYYTDVRAQTPRVTSLENDVIVALRDPADFPEVQAYMKAVNNANMGRHMQGCRTIP